MAKEEFSMGRELNGRPRKFKTPEALQEKIQEYFNKCLNNKRKAISKLGKEVDIPYPIPLTIEGLAGVLMCDRETILNYSRTEGYEEFFGTIKWAKNVIQNDKVTRGLSGESNAAFSIFDLKNNSGYVDKQEIKTEGDINITGFNYVKPEDK